MDPVLENLGYIRYNIAYSNVTKVIFSVDISAMLREFADNKTIKRLFHASLKGLRIPLISL